MSHQFVAALLQRCQSEEFRLTVEAHQRIWRALDEEIGRLEAKLKEQVADDPNDKSYRSSPEMGPVSARVCANELGNMSQFDNERQLFSYTADISQVRKEL